MITAEGMAAVDENMAGATLTSVMTENATSVTVDDDRFEVADGNLKLKDGMSLDFEGDDGGSIDVTITATGDGESATHTVTVTINDVQEAPTIDVRDGEEVPQKGVTSSLTIDENATGADLPPLALIHVTDPDAADATTGQAGADLVTLSGAMAEYFEVVLDPENGLWLAVKAGVSFNYEEHGGSVMVTVTYTDTGGHAASQDVTVTIMDVNEAPVADADMEVDDAVFAGGGENSITVDLKALFSDPDGDVLTYRLSDNAPDWLELSVTVRGTGDDQTIMGTISGTPPTGRDMSLDGVMIIASDGDGMEASASFDIIVDAENDAPTRLELRVTEDDGFVVRTDEVDVDEGDEGAVIGLLKVTDEDDPRHPHGMHTYSFMVDGEEDDRFEVDMDGNLKLKDDESLNHEDDAEIVLTVTATDMHVGDHEGGEGSASLDITITVKNVAAADRPVANKKIGDWWVTVDDDLEAEDVRDGDWLSFRLDTTGDDAAFSHEDGDDLTYTLDSVVDADGNGVDWLQISDSGMMTNKADMLPDAGVYTVTVRATDEDGDWAQTEFKLAVAISDDPGTGDRDNDTPDIRDVEEFDYQEGAGAQKVASFSVRDDDVAIYPHPYGTLTVTFTAMQEGDGATMDVKNRLKIVEVGRNEDSVHYEIWTKSAAELAVDDKGKALKTPVKPLDFENGDEIDIEVTVVDGAEEMDDKVITIDLDDAADEAPAFMHSAVHEDATRNAAKKTTTVKVDQQADKQVIVVQLSEAWEDADTDDDELHFSIGGKGGLPDWITVYGPDDWEDIYERQRDVDRGDADSSIRDRDIVFAIVIDRSGAGDGDNASLMSGSFTVTARDEDGNSATETIMISVNDKNVNIADDDEDDVVDITGNLAGSGSLMMDVDLSLDPDLGGADDATLVVYTWSYDPGTPNDATDDVMMVSSTPQPLALITDRTTTPPTRIADGTVITAKVQYYEIDPETHAIVQSKEYTDTATVGALPPAGETPTTVSFEVTTSETGLSVDITATGDALSATAPVQLQASTNGTSGWITVSRATADTSGGSAADVALTVDEDGDGTGGDGGGLYYRVVYSYTADNRTQTVHYDVGRLGELDDPDTLVTVTNIIGGTPTVGPDVGETLRIDTDGHDAEVQWEYRDPMATAPVWKPISGATSLELRVTSAHTGKMLRAKVTYTGDDIPATTGVNEDGWPVWVEYTEVLTVSAVDATNDVPENTGENSEIAVELRAMMGMNQPTKVVKFDASDLFHDPDGDALTYTITSFETGSSSAVLASSDATATADGWSVGEIESALVWRVHKAVWNADADPAASEVSDDDLQQSLAIDSKTGEITYFTDQSHTHDGSNTDGEGNWLTFEISATDSKAGTTVATQDVTIRINVAPTAIHLTTGTDPALTDGAGATLSDAALSAKKAMPTAFTVADGTNTPDDDGTEDDLYTIAENLKNQPAVVLGTLNVQDENAIAHKYGTHSWTVSDSRFEVVKGAATPGDGSMWTLRIKQGATFNYEADGDKAGTLVVTITATDGGGLKTSAHFSIQISDVDEPAPTRPPAPDPEPDTVPGLEDDADDSDEDGPVVPPDGGMFIDDLLDQFVISIDDIDVA